MFVRRIAFYALSLFGVLLSTTVHAIEFVSLECARLTFSPAVSYDVNVPCTAVVSRAGSGRWYDAFGQECSSFCRALQRVNLPSPDGFRCTSGEERPWSAIGVVTFAPTGCWHDCRYPEGRPGGMSVGPRCYAPGQKRDNDRTDTTVGCFCATGDTDSDVIDIGIYAGGTAESAGVTQWVTGLTHLTAATMNDRPGRVSYLRGSIPLAGEAVVRFVVNVKGACGTRVVMSGRTNGSGGTTSDSQELRIELPPCPSSCSDGIDNDTDGLIDGQDPGCADAKDDSEDDEGALCDFTVRHSEEIAELEEIVRAQRIVVYELLDPILKTTTDPTQRAEAKSLRTAADTIKRGLVRDMHRRYPKTTLQCSRCVTQDLAAVIQDFVAHSRRMLRLTKQVAAFARTVNPQLIVRGSLQSADSLFERYSTAVQALPSTTSLCP